MQLEQIKRVAVSAADQAAGILRPLRNNISTIYAKNSAIDRVAEADARPEGANVEAIRKHVPGHSVLSAETIVTDFKKTGRLCPKIRASNGLIHSEMLSLLELKKDMECKKNY